VSSPLQLALFTHARNHANRLRERDELNFEFGRLQLEQATWAEANRIEQVATQRLGLKFPADAEIEVVQP
jgi:cell division protein FtsL